MCECLGTLYDSGGALGNNSGAESRIFSSRINTEVGATGYYNESGRTTYPLPFLRVELPILIMDLAGPPPTTS